MASIDLVKLAARDTERRREVMSMLVLGELRAAKDFFNASQVFHHGETIDDFKLAFSLGLWCRQGLAATQA